LRIPLKEGIGGETRGDRGETEGDFVDNSITVFLISWVCKLDRGFHPQTVHNHPPQTACCERNRCEQFATKMLEQQVFKNRVNKQSE